MLQNVQCSRLLLETTSVKLSWWCYDVKGRCSMNWLIHFYQEISSCFIHDEVTIILKTHNFSTWLYAPNMYHVLFKTEKGWTMKECRAEKERKKGMKETINKEGWERENGAMSPSHFTPFLYLSKKYSVSVYQSTQYKEHPHSPPSLLPLWE